MKKHSRKAQGSVSKILAAQIDRELKSKNGTAADEGDDDDDDEHTKADNFSSDDDGSLWHLLIINTCLGPDAVRLPQSVASSSSSPPSLGSLLAHYYQTAWDISCEAPPALVELGWRAQRERKPPAKRKAAATKAKAKTESSSSSNAAAVDWDKLLESTKKVMERGSGGCGALSASDWIWQVPHTVLGRHSALPSCCRLRDDTCISRQQCKIVFVTSASMGRYFACLYPPPPPSSPLSSSLPSSSDNSEDEKGGEGGGGRKKYYLLINYGANPVYVNDTAVEQFHSLPLHLNDVISFLECAYDEDGGIFEPGSLPRLASSSAAAADNDNAMVSKSEGLLRHRAKSVELVSSLAPREQQQQLMATAGSSLLRPLIVDDEDSCFSKNGVAADKGNAHSEDEEEGRQEGGGEKGEMERGLPIGHLSFLSRFIAASFTAAGCPLASRDALSPALFFASLSNRNTFKIFGDSLTNGAGASGTTSPVVVGKLKPLFIPAGLVAFLNAFLEAHGVQTNREATPPPTISIGGNTSSSPTPNATLAVAGNRIILKERAPSEVPGGTFQTVLRDLSVSPYAKVKKSARTKKTIRPRTKLGGGGSEGREGGGEEEGRRWRQLLEELEEGGDDGVVDSVSSPLRGGIVVNAAAARRLVVDMLGETKKEEKPKRKMEEEEEEEEQTPWKTSSSKGSPFKALIDQLTHSSRGSNAEPVSRCLSFAPKDAAAAFSSPGQQQQQEEPKIFSFMTMKPATVPVFLVSRRARSPPATLTGDSAHRQGRWAPAWARPDTASTGGKKVSYYYYYEGDTAGEDEEREGGGAREGKDGGAEPVKEAHEDGAVWVVEEAPKKKRARRW